MEEYRGGGMDAPVDIDLGMQKLEFTWTSGGVVNNAFWTDNGEVEAVKIHDDGLLTITHRDWTGSSLNSSVADPFSISFVIAGNIP